MCLNTTFEFVITAQVTLPGGAAPLGAAAQAGDPHRRQGLVAVPEAAGGDRRAASGQYVAARSTSEGKFLTEWRAEHLTGRDL